jgi:hypothetical protein
MGFLSDLLDPGKQNRELASQFSQMAVPTGGRATGPGGIFAGFNFDPSGRGSISTGLGSFSPFLSMLQGHAAQGFDIAGRGLDPSLTALGEGAMADMGTPDIQRFGNLGGAGALQGILGSAGGIASADPFALGESTTAALRSRAQRSNQNLVNKTFDQLFASGGLSNQVTREQVTGDLSRQLDEQDLGFQLAGLEQGRGLQQEAFGRAMGAFGGLEQFGGRMFGEQMGATNLAAQLAQQRFGIGSQLQNMALQQAMAGQQLGIGALSAGQGLAQLPLAFLSAQLQAQGLRSDAALGAGGVQTKLAENATSPFLSGLEAVGQFGQGIGGFGGIGDFFKGLFNRGQG